MKYSKLPEQKIDTISIVVDLDQKNLLQLLELSTSTDGNRPTLCKIFVDDTMLVATNGFHMTITTNFIEELKPFAKHSFLPMSFVKTARNTFELNCAIYEPDNFPAWEVMLKPPSTTMLSQSTRYAFNVKQLSTLTAQYGRIAKYIRMTIQSPTVPLTISNGEILEGYPLEDGQAISIVMPVDPNAI